MPSARGLALTLLLSTLVAPTLAGAQSAAPATDAPATTLPPAPPARPDATAFRGQRTVGIDPADVALFVPRVVLFPLHLISEFVLRRPLMALSGAIESGTLHLWIPAVLHPVRTISWSPSFSLVLGYTPLFGANATVDDVGARGNQIRARALFGEEAHDLALQDRLTLGPMRFGLRGSSYERPDLTFYGLGNMSSGRHMPRYHLVRRDATAFIQLRPSHHFWLDVSASYRRDLTGPGEGDSVTRHFDPQDPTQLPGFGPLALAVGNAALTVDSRANPDVRSGVRLEATAMAAADTELSDTRFGVATAELEGAVEVSHPGRVLVGAIYVADSHAFGASPVPFTYLPTLGGARHPGFPVGRFTGPSAVLAEVRYLYPIWSHLDAIWQVSVGNVFAEHFRDFDARLMTGSAGLGIRSVFPGRDALEAIVALGTTRFDQPIGVDGVRVALSLNRGL